MSTELQIISEKIDNDLKFIDYYYLDEDGQVYTFGEETWNYGGYEKHYGDFDAEMLTWTDEQLREYVDEKIKEREVVARLVSNTISNILA